MTRDRRFLDEALTVLAIDYNGLKKYWVSDNVVS